MNMVHPDHRWHWHVLMTAYGVDKPELAGSSYNEENTRALRSRVVEQKISQEGGWSFTLPASPTVIAYLPETTAKPALLYTLAGPCPELECPWEKEREG
jgi:hypothetical protein